MGETAYYVKTPADHMKEEVEAARARLGQDLNELQYRVRSELDWRVQFYRYPWVFVGAAFLVSVLFGAVLRGAPRSKAPIVR